MRIVMKLMIISLILLVGSMLSNVVLAGDSESVTPKIEVSAEFGEPVSGNILDSLSGGQSMQIDTIDMLMNHMNIQSDLEKNMLLSTSTGVNMISNDAFSGASGISTVIQNSGNQVIINSALILNLRVQ